MNMNTTTLIPFIPAMTTKEYREMGEQNRAVHEHFVDRIKAARGLVPSFDVRHVSCLELTSRVAIMPGLVSRTSQEMVDARGVSAELLRRERLRDSRADFAKANSRRLAETVIYWRQ